MKILLLLLSLNASADCLHKPTCFLAQMIEQKPQKSLFDIPKEAHDFAPTTTQMKMVSSAPELYLPPVELFSWSQKMASIRGDKVTKIIELPKNFQATAGDYSHFWLYPEVLKSMLTPKAQETYQQKITQIIAKREQLFKEIKASKQNILFILTHDALVPFFNNEKLPYLVLHYHHGHGGGHSGGAISTKLMKKLTNLNSPDLASTKKVWIFEEGISTPMAIKDFIKDDAVTMQIDLEKMDKDIFEPLDTILNLLGNHTKQ